MAPSTDTVLYNSWRIRQLHKSRKRLLCCLGRMKEVDTPHKYMTDGDEALEGPLFRAMTRAAALEGVFYVVADDGIIRSLTLCYRPGTQMFGSETTNNLLQKQWYEGFGSVSVGQASIGSSWSMDGLYAQVEPLGAGVVLNPAFQPFKSITNWP
ncbi:hypothetical protein C8J56DRAFT_1064935 [Mycena floridula]|nr:hypothetical protein C8J56DRAFT_1064935 [Mycena floridula]